MSMETSGDDLWDVSVDPSDMKKEGFFGELENFIHHLYVDPITPATNDEIEAMWSQFRGPGGNQSECATGLDPDA